MVQISLLFRSNKTGEGLCPNTRTVLFVTVEFIEVRIMISSENWSLQNYEQQLQH